MKRTSKPSALIKIFASTLLINGFIGFGSIMYSFGAAPRVSMELIFVGLTIPAVGLISGPFAFRNQLWALIVGLLFYAVQFVRYYSPIFNLGFFSGFHIDISMPIQNATVAINLLAIGFFFLGLTAIEGRRAVLIENDV
jgi:hypothetical protein